MKLFHLIFGTEAANSAPYYFIQHGHCETAVSTAIDIFNHQRDTEQTADPDPLMSGPTNTIRNWLIETLIQGAYLREYHIWEKHVKGYLNDQRRWNGEKEIDWQKGGTNMVLRVQSHLSDFAVVIDDRIMLAIDAMRKKVNQMKHEPGLFDEHFVSVDDYQTGHQAIEGFWSHLTEIEERVMHLPGFRSGT